MRRLLRWLLFCPHDATIKVRIEGRLHLECPDCGRVFPVLRVL